MQAMILAAGLGKRMLPLSNTIPKPLLPVRGQPLIAHLLQSLKKNGVQKVVINVHHLKEQIKNFLENGSSYGMEILYSEEKELLETGGGILNALPLLDNAPFIVVSADIYSEYPFASLPPALSGLAHLVLVDNPPFNLKGDFVLQGRQISLAGDNPLTYASIGIFKKEFFNDPPGTVFPLNFLFTRAIKNNLITGEHFAGVWHNIGTIDLLHAAQGIKNEQ